MDLSEVEDVIGRAAVDGGLRHHGDVRFEWVLSDGEAALVLDRPHPGGAVAIGAGQQNA